MDCGDAAATAIADDDDDAGSAECRPARVWAKGHRRYAAYAGTAEDELRSLGQNVKGLHEDYIKGSLGTLGTVESVIAFSTLQAETLQKTSRRIHCGR